MDGMMCSAQNRQSLLYNYRSLVTSTANIEASVTISDLRRKIVVVNSAAVYTDEWRDQNAQFNKREVIRGEYPEEQISN